MDLLANIDESELEGLLHDPDFLNIDPNLSTEERKKIIEEIRFVPIGNHLSFISSISSRKKHAKKKVIEIPPLSKEKLQEIDDPLDYLYRYCIIQFVEILPSSSSSSFRIVLIEWQITNEFFSIQSKSKPRNFKAKILRSLPPN